MWLAVVAAAAVVSAADERPRSAQGEALVAAVQASLDQVRQRQAGLPPPRDDADRIIRLGELDQAPRMVVTRFDWSTIPPEDRVATFRGEGAIMEASDQANLTQLLRMLPAEGWFLKSRYGPAAARAAFLIVQHSNLETQRRFLPRLQALARTGEVDGEDFGGMSDRVAISEGRPQRYGTQFRCDGGKWRPYPIEDEANLEGSRRALGFRITFDQTLAFFRAQPPCPQTPTPPPPGMKLD